MFKQETTTTQDDLFQYICDNVEELQQQWTMDFEELYGPRIWEAYLDECETCGTELSPEEFVDDMDNSIGWSWVTENE
jgi:hypothetical protein